MLKAVLFTGTVFAFTASGAFAADIVEPAAYDWTGAYIGLQGGYGWGKTDMDADPDSNLPFITRVSVEDFKADGFVGGLHAGYLLQSDRFVYGLEGDLEYADMKDDRDIVLNVDGYAGTVEKDIDWLGSLRLRAGLAFDRTLVYATGGLALGGTSLDTDLTDFIKSRGLQNDAEDKTKWGWTIGAGLEYALADHLSARIEYRYTDLGRTDIRVENANGVGVDGKADNDFHAVRAGLSWHFNPL